MIATCILPSYKVRGLPYYRLLYKKTVCVGLFVIMRFVPFYNRSTVRNGVARICCEEGQKLKLCHGALTVDFGAGCSSCSMTNSFLTNTLGLY